METIPQEVQQEIMLLFKQQKTVREIAEITGHDKRDILLYLTKLGKWSAYCSGCVLKRCYDCKGLEELGKPISIQDEIDFLAMLKDKNANGS